MDRDNLRLLILFILAIGSIIAIMIVGVKQDNKRSQMAAEHGCTYLGKARDLIGVTFYNCNGEIVMRPSGKEL